jgi:hypothetical protein
MALPIPRSFDLEATVMIRQVRSRLAIRGRPVHVPEILMEIVTTAEQDQGDVTDVGLAQREGMPKLVELDLSRTFLKHGTAPIGILT